MGGAVQQESYRVCFKGRSLQLQIRVGLTKWLLSGVEVKVTGAENRES